MEIVVVVVGKTRRRSIVWGGFSSEFRIVKMLKSGVLTCIDPHCCVVLCKQMKDWVVCKMYKNESRRSRKRKRKRNPENTNPAYTEAIRPVDDSSTAMASPNFECFKLWKNFKVDCVSLSK